MERIEQQLVLQVSVDILFALNFVVDLAWLLTTGILVGHRPRLRRVALGAALGAAGAVWAYFPSGRWLASLPGMVLGTAAVLALTFWPCRVRQAVRLAGSALLCGAAMGGSALLLALRERDPARVASSPWAEIGSTMVIVGLMLCLGGGRYLWDLLTTRARLARGVYTLRIRLGERTAETVAILDTGNSLRDPLTRLPVTVVEACVLEQLLPPGVLAAVQAGWDALDRLPEGWLARCRLVPYRAVGQPGGMMLAFTPDELWVRAPAAALWVRAPGLVGVSREPLHPDGAYRALLSADFDEAGDGISATTWEGATG